MNDPSCRNVRDRLFEAATDPLDERTSAHVGSCADCAGLLARERRLVALLRATPAAPRATFAAPRLPPVPAGRLLRLRLPVGVAAAAATVLVAVFVGAVWRWRATAPRFVRVERVVTLTDAPPVVDERLLALTAGIEAVAMRRPTEIR